jgi:anti-sigma B factor antagonist
MALDMQTRDAGGWHVIAVRGEVDLNSSPQLRKLVLAGIDRMSRVAVDLSGAEYMDSSGVATMVEALKAASEKKKKFALLSPSSAVTRVLELARLNSLFDIRASLEGA